MIRLVQTFLRKWWKEEKGTYTIEAALVLPILLVILLCFILAGCYVYQSVVTSYTIGSSVDRAAFNWDNSKRDYESGILMKAEYDPLYSKLTTSGVLSTLFEWSGLSEKQEVAIPYASNERNLTKTKLIGAVNWLDEKSFGIAGKAEYNQHFLVPNIAMYADKARRGYTEHYEAKSAVVDPVEFNRSVQLFAYYTKKLKKNSAEEQDNWSNQKVQGIINRFVRMK